MKKIIALVMMVAMLICGFGNAFAATVFESLLEECFTYTGKSSFLEYTLGFEPLSNTCTCLCDDSGFLVMEYCDDNGNYYIHTEEDFEIDTVLATLKIFKEHTDAIFFSYYAEESDTWAYSPYLENEDGTYDDWDEFTAAILAAM